MAGLFTKHLEPLFLFRKGLGFIITLLLAGVCFAFYLLFTAPGAKNVLSFISNITPYQIEFSELSGSLSHSLAIEDLSIKAPSFQAQAKNVQIAWQFVDLLRKEKTLQYLKVQQLVLVTTPTEKIPLKITSTPTLHSPMVSLQSALKQILPAHLHIENVILNDSVIQWNNQNYYINEFMVKKASNNLLNIAEIHYQGTWGSAHAYLQEAIKIEWDLHFPAALNLLTFIPQFSSSQAITTQGQIYLPDRQLDSAKSKLQMQLQTKAVQLSGRPIQDLVFHLNGNLASHTATLKGKHQNQPFSFNLTGHLLDQKWEGKLDKFELKAFEWEKAKKMTGHMLIDWHAKEVLSDMRLLLEEHPIHLQANIGKQAPYALSGKIETQTTHLKALAEVIPQIPHIDGKLQAHLKLAGTLLKPTWNGEFFLKDLKFHSTTLKSKAIVQSLHLTVLENKMNMEGKGTWGSGTFNIQGNGYLDKDNPSLTVNFKGSHLLLSDTPEYHIVADPDLKLTLKNGVPFLEGSVFVPQAQIQSFKNRESVTASQDVVIVSASKKQKKKDKASLASKLATQIDITLGDVSYKGFGFTSQVQGKLQIKQQPGQPPLGKGKLVLKEGKYRGYGKTFDISYGQLLFSGGPVADPTLDIQAERQIRPAISLSTVTQNAQLIKAGVKFTGTLKTPHLAFYSTPHMSDADVLSYLVVGRPQNQVNEAQADLLFQAVSQLASVMGKGRKDVNFDLAERLKLDQFGFVKKSNAIASTTNPLENTVFVLGKQLSDRLYLHYSVGVLDSASNVGLRYLLGKYLTIEAAAGNDGPSADVLLSFEGR